MAGKEANELSTIPSLATNDLVVVYDTSESADEKLKNMVYSDFKSDILSGYATTSYVDANIITDHGGLTGLDDDDHSHYYNTTRLEAWWSTKVVDLDDHNELNNIQGGTTDEYYHLTSSEYTEFQAGYVPWNFGSGTISGTGDIYCNDIYTSSGTVYIGDLKLSDSGAGELLVNDSPISSEPPPFPLYPGNAVDPSLGQPGNQSLEISVVNGLAVILNDDGAGGGVASVSAADFIRSIKCWPDNWSSLTYGILEAGDSEPPTFYSDPSDAELIVTCADAATLLVRVWVNDPSWGYKYAETYVLVQDNDLVCP